MAAGNVTITAVDALTEGWIWDAGHRSAVVGFGARRQRDGVFYYLRYRLGGRQRMLSIGRHGSPWTPDTARRKAKEMLGSVAKGIDPAASDAASRTFSEEVERYLSVHPGRPRTVYDITRHLRHHCKTLGPLGLSEITRRAIAETLARVETESGPVARNRCRSSLSAFFSWAIAEGLLSDDAVNPVKATATADEGGSRTRVLSEAELTAILRALGDDRYSDIVRLLLLTGQRREEIGGLRWDEVTAPEIDPATLQPLAGATGSISLPPSRTKNGLAHTLPLSPQAWAIIDRRIAADASGAFVFGPRRGFCGWSAKKTQLDTRLAAQAGSVPHWTLHDLRRTAATMMADKLGVFPHVVEVILNHVSGHKSGVAGVYNLARHTTEMRAALTAWANHVDTLAAPATPSIPPRPKSLRLVRAT